MRKDYELLEHTADIAIKVKGDSLEALFKNAAVAMFDIMAEYIPGKKTSRAEKLLIKKEAANLEELFISWLNELLYHTMTKGKIFCEIMFKNLDEHGLKAVVGGKDMINYKIKTEIKAATYHELEIKKVGPSWQAKVVFDV